MNTGETNVPVSDWTTGSLKVYQDEKIGAVERLGKAEDRRLNDLHYADVKRLEESIHDIEQTSRTEGAARQLAQDKFEATVQRDSVKQNEFRDSLSDLGKNMATKIELAASNKASDDKFAEHGKQLAELRSRLDVGNPAIGSIQQQLATAQGIQKGSDVTIGKIYAAIGAVGVILGILVLLANGVFTR